MKFYPSRSSIFLFSWANESRRARCEVRNERKSNCKYALRPRRLAFVHTGVDALSKHQRRQSLFHFGSSLLEHFFKPNLIKVCASSAQVVPGIPSLVCEQTSFVSPPYSPPPPRSAFLSYFQRESPAFRTNRTSRYVEFYMWRAGHPSDICLPPLVPTFILDMLSLILFYYLWRGKQARRKCKER